MSEEYEEIFETEPPVYHDDVAQRVHAFTGLAVRINDMRDEKARELAYTMLRVVTNTIRTLPRGDITEVRNVKE